METGSKGGMAVLFWGLVVVTTRAAPTIMNAAAPNGKYRIANPPPGKSPYLDINISHRGKYIEVYSPNISTRLVVFLVKRRCWAHDDRFQDSHALARTRGPVVT